MSLSSSPITRTPPASERSSQRSERAPAGDFAALLELAPTPARAPLTQAAGRREPDRGAADARDDRRDHSAPASPRSRHARPDGGRPAGAPGRHATRPDGAVGRGPVAADALAGPATAGAAAVPTAAEAAAVPTPGATAAMAGEPPPADVTSPETAAPPPPPNLLAVAGPPIVDSPVAVVAAEPLVVGPVPGTAASPLAAADPHALAPVFAGPAGPSPGGVVAATGVAALAGGTVPAALGDGTADAVPAATAAPVPVLEPVEAGAVATEARGTVAAPVSDAAAAAVTTGGAETTDADGGPPGGTEPATGDLPTGTGTSTGPAGGLAGARDGQTGRGPSPEAAEAPAGASAPATAATAPPGFGRMPEAVASGSQRSIPLERAPRAVAQLLHVASQQGVSHARIALRPVELGGIEIYLQVSPAGLAAQLVAESPEAARMLAQATEDLRRSLAGQDVELISLEVSTSGQQQQQRDDIASRGFDPDDLAPGGRSTPRRGDAGSDPAATSPALTTPTVIELPDGLLVDVLA